MNAVESIAKRYSCRSYRPEQIPEEAMEAILKAGMAAPVGSGTYDSLHITVVQNWDMLNEIGNAVTDLVEKMLGKRMDKNFGAPTMAIVSSKPAMLPGIEYANASCVLENMAIAATSLGIDNIIWAGPAAITNSEEWKAKLGIPEEFKPLMCASFGYAQKSEEPKKHTISVNRVS